MPSPAFPPLFTPDTCADWSDRDRGTLNLVADQLRTLREPWLSPYQWDSAIADALTNCVTEQRPLQAIDLYVEAARLQGVGQPGDADWAAEQARARAQDRVRRAGCLYVGIDDPTYPDDPAAAAQWVCTCPACTDR